MRIYKKLFLFSLTTAFVLLPQLSLAQLNPNASVEAVVRASFPDMPEMIPIAQCESGFRQFNADGTPLRGGSSKNYIGIFQISEKIHAAKAKSMAYDIYSAEGNIAYARYMYFASGTVPWVSCLKGSATTIPPTPSIIPSSPQAPSAQASISGSLSANLNFGMTHSQILILQQLLNKSGFVISYSGPGSPGSETNYFGNLTREAVKEFQCAKAIVCQGNESSTGFGRVGPKTRAVLNSM